MGGARNSCCLYEARGCGTDLFEITDLRVIVLKTHVHGCLAVMQRTLETHVTVILMVFAVVELLAV